MLIIKGISSSVNNNTQANYVNSSSLDSAQPEGGGVQQLSGSTTSIADVGERRGFRSFLSRIFKRRHVSQSSDTQGSSSSRTKNKEAAAEKSLQDPASWAKDMLDSFSKNNQVEAHSQIISMFGPNGTFPLKNLSETQRKALLEALPKDFCPNLATGETTTQLPLLALKYALESFSEPQTVQDEIAVLSEYPKNPTFQKPNLRDKELQKYLIISTPLPARTSSSTATRVQRKTAAKLRQEQLKSEPIQQFVRIGETFNKLIPPSNTSNSTGIIR